MSKLDSTITIKGNEYRPCCVDGQPAVFHRWAEEEQIVLKPCRMQKSNNEDFSGVKMVDNMLIIPPYISFEKVKTTFGIVELKDGSVRKVKLEDVRFTDTYYLNFDGIKEMPDIMKKIMNIQKPAAPEE